MYINDNATNKPQFKVGVNGNYYVYCKIKEPLIIIANQIGKSTVSIYRNEKYNVWVIRVKQKSHKEALRKLFATL